MFDEKALMVIFWIHIAAICAIAIGAWELFKWMIQ
jgi:hypothetical protein